VDKNAKQTRRWLAAAAAAAVAMTSAMRATLCVCVCVCVCGKTRFPVWRLFNFIEKLFQCSLLVVRMQTVECGCL